MGGARFRILGGPRFRILVGRARFRILGGGGGSRFRILGGGASGANSQQAHDVEMATLLRRIDVISTSCAH